MAEVTVNREVKVHRRTMRGYSTGFDAENDFLINSDILAELREELKSKIRLKTPSTHKKVTYGEI